MSTSGDNIGIRIQAVRKSKNLTVKELCDKVHVTKQTWYQYEKDVRRPEATKLADIADELSVSLDYLTCRTDIRYDPRDEDFSKLMDVFLGLKPEERRQIIETAKNYRRNDNDY